MMDMGIKEKERVLLQGNYLLNRAGVKGEKRKLTGMFFLALSHSSIQLHTMYNQS